MKYLTKEWLKDVQLHDLIVILKPNTNKMLPFVFTNGGTESVAQEDLYTVKTNLDVTEKENEISFVMLPETFDIGFDYLGDGEVINEETCKNDFLFEYLNRLRVISYLPDEILKLVKDKRLLALGYAESKVKNAILEYAKNKYRKAYDLSDNCYARSVEVEKELTVHEQIERSKYLDSLSFLFDGADIIKVEIIGDSIYLTLQDIATVEICGAEIIEEEVDMLYSYVREYELYKSGDSYELHLLLVKRDENLISQSFYATYKFKDMKLKD